MADFHSYFKSFLPSSWVFESGTTRPGGATKNERQPSTVADAKGRVGRVVGAAMMVAATTIAADISDFTYRGGRGDLLPMPFEGRLAVPDALKPEMVSAGYWRSVMHALERMQPTDSVYIPESWTK